MARTGKVPKPARPNRADAALPTAPAWNWRVDAGIALFLLLATVGVYLPVRHHEFIDYDDPVYVTANPQVRAGLTAAGMKWAFTTPSDANWIPLAWVSLMTDVQFFGVNSGAMHLTNVAIHAMNAMLLFALFRHLTGARWRSGFVAFLFALHPLHVESVAWIAERKDVLSGLFFFLTLWAYARWVDRPGTRRYLAILLVLALGLMAKPMLVTVPFVLLLLDIWPLHRLRMDDTAALRARIREKIPLFGLSLASSVITFFVQRQGGAVSRLDSFPIGARAGNAAISCVAYLAQMFWPWKLAPFYPGRPDVSLWQAVGACMVIAGISVMAVRSMRTWPYLAVGWFWFLGMLAPVIGLVQVGGQARADRYTYVPLIGISIMAAWSAGEACEWKPGLKPVVSGLGVVVCAAFAGMTWVQAGYWRDSVTLFEHALDVTLDNAVMQHNLGLALTERGDNAAAVPHLREALRLQPAYFQGHYNLGKALVAMGRQKEALESFTEAVRLKPDYAEAQFARAMMLQALGRNNEAEIAWQNVLRLSLEPHFMADAHNSLGVLLGQRGDAAGALDQFEQATRLNPGLASAHLNLARALVDQGRLSDAVAHLTSALPLTGDDRSVREIRDMLQSRLGK